MHLLFPHYEVKPQTLTTNFYSDDLANLLHLSEPTNTHPEDETKLHLWGLEN